jgi:hypothetical protein
LLNELYLAAHTALTLWLRHRTHDSIDQPGLVIAVHRLQAAGAITAWHIAQLPSWRHGGFSLDAGSRSISCAPPSPWPKFGK